MSRWLTCLFCLLVSYSSMAHPGIGIVMDSKGNVFYTDLVHVWKITPEGNRSIAVKNVHTHELYLDEQDNLYGEHEWYEGEATDKWGNYVWCLSKDGRLEKSIQDVEGFLHNNTLVRDLDGNTYWTQKATDHEFLMKQSPTEKIDLFTEHPFKDIRWKYFSKEDQNLYVVDHLKIKKVNPSGEVSIIAADLKEDKPAFEGVADRHYLFGLWTDKNKDLYVAVYGTGKVVKINSQGKEMTIFESAKGWSPCGGMVAPDGTLWIMEFSDKNKTRVRKVNPNGDDTLYEG